MEKETEKPRKVYLTGVAYGKARDGDDTPSPKEEPTEVNGEE